MGVPTSTASSLYLPLIIIKPHFLDTSQIFSTNNSLTTNITIIIMDAFTNKTSQQPAAGGAPAGQKDDYVDKGESPSLLHCSGPSWTTPRP